jgi:hypothetical protein
VRGIPQRRPEREQPDRQRRHAVIGLRLGERQGLYVLLEAAQGIFHFPVSVAFVEWQAGQISEVERRHA